MTTNDGDDASRQAIEELLADLDGQTKTLLDTARVVQDVEHDLVLTTTQFLLEEDESEAAADGAKA